MAERGKVLITGGFGYLGGRLIEGLIPHVDLLISSRVGKSNTSEFLVPNVTIIEHSSLLVENTFPDNVSTVIHLAALNEIDCVAHPELAIEVNINQTRKILENSIKRNVKSFIYFSTMHVYGKNLTGLIKETSPTRPTHPYSITHRTAEDYVNAAHDQGRIRGIVLRLSNSFGAPVNPNVNRWTLLVNDICRQAVMDSRIKLTSNGCQYRDFITLSDVVNSVLHLINFDVSGQENIFNLSLGKSISVLEMANKVAAISAEVLKIDVGVLVPEGSKPTSESYYEISSQRLSSTGFALDNRVDEELTRMVKFCMIHFSSK
jgi:UDP-glucose 4-epimerase